jgi:hypothetical protein
MDPRQPGAWRPLRDADFVLGASTFAMMTTYRLGPKNMRLWQQKKTSSDSPFAVVAQIGPRRSFLPLEDYRLTTDGQEPHDRDGPWIWRAMPNLA